MKQWPNNESDDKTDLKNLKERARNGHTRNQPTQHYRIRLQSIQQQD